MTVLIDLAIVKYSYNLICDLAVYLLGKIPQNKKQTIHE